MKKLWSLALILCLVFTFSALVMAGYDEDDDNQLTPGVNDPDWKLNKEGGIFENYDPFQGFFDSYSEIDAKWKTITNARVTGSMSDINYQPGGQEAAVKIKTKANIPCYLEMELIGNAGLSKVKSVGANMVGTLDRSNEQHWMLFDSNFGGFINKNWESISRESYDTIAPNRSERAPIYLQACDMWTATLYANINYGFDVTATALKNENNPDQQLKMDMRSTMKGNADWAEYEAFDTVTVGKFAAREENTVYMQFRVPYSADVDAGQYNGSITFKIYSI